MAHCIYLEDEELKMFEEKKVGIAHCPNSNFWYSYIIHIYIRTNTFCVDALSVFAVAYLILGECWTVE